MLAVKEESAGTVAGKVRGYEDTLWSMLLIFHTTPSEGPIRVGEGEGGDAPGKEGEGTAYRTITTPEPPFPP